MLKEVLCGLAVGIFVVGLGYTVYHCYRLARRGCFVLALWWQQMTDESVDKLVTKTRQLERELESAHNCYHEKTREILWMWFLAKELYRYQREDAPTRKYTYEHYKDYVHKQAVSGKRPDPDNMTFEEIFDAWPVLRQRDEKS